MIRKTFSILSAGLVAAVLLLPYAAMAQVTTGNITGRVVDSSGGVVPGASVSLVSEVHGNKIAPVKTNASGDYTFADITADTYTVEVTAPAFKTTRETGIQVTGGDRVGVPLITLQVGATSETVSVTAEATLVQTQSGERSYAIETTQIDELPIGHANFANAVAFAPGMDGTSRLGAPTAENNFMMDGVSAMDTGNNGQMLQMNIESIGEVKVITQGYQAEFGRSAGAQITAVTKSGSNSFHGAGYGIFTNSLWNSRSWANQEERPPTTVYLREHIRLHGGRTGVDPESFQREKQTVLLHRGRVPSDNFHRRHQQSVPAADAARAERRFFSVPQQ